MDPFLTVQKGILRAVALQGKNTLGTLGYCMREGGKGPSRVPEGPPSFPRLLPALPPIPPKSPQVSGSSFRVFLGGEEEGVFKTINRSSIMFYLKSSNFFLAKGPVGEALWPCSLRHGSLGMSIYDSY